MTTDPDLDSVRDYLSRVTFRPNGGAVVPLHAARRADGRLFVLHDLRCLDSRGSASYVGTRFGDPYRGASFDEASIRANVAAAIASASAHEGLEWLRVDGELVHDPHKDGEPVVYFASAPI